MQSDDLGLASLLRSRIGVEFDGEAHLTDAEAQSIAAAIERLEANKKELRRIISECAAALPNGAFLSPEASIEFMANLPSEIKACSERLVAERDETRRQFWLELREPGCVPERKGPWPHHMTAMTLREFMRERPEAFITVVSFVDGGPLLQDGPECLQMLDGRSMSTGRRHIKSSNAARARQALGDT